MRKTNITITPFLLNINSKHDGWGISILKINYNLKSYSLFDITALLPNGGNQKLKIFGDILFTRTPLLKHLESLLDTLMWGKLSKFDNIKLDILNSIFN